MTRLDRWIQRWRISKVRPLIPTGSRLLDVGCHEGELFQQLGARIASGVGVDPELRDSVEQGRYRLLPGTFPDALSDSPDSFDVVTLLAVMEHIPPDEQIRLVENLSTRVEVGGTVIITVPSPFVDKILAILESLRLIDGMSLEQHYGFEPANLQELFCGKGFELDQHRRFQMGLNHLFVFRRQSAATAHSRSL